MKCKECEKPCVIKEKQFYFRGKYFTGYICEACKALYVNEKDSMFEYEKQLRENEKNNEIT